LRGRLKVIHKYELSVMDEQQILIGEGFVRFLSVANQRGKLCLWVLVDTSVMTFAGMRLNIRIIGTGNAAAVEEGMDYIGSAVVEPFVWHVFGKASL
jgi:hypothetical protein